MTGRESGRLEKEEAEVLIPERLGRHRPELKVPWEFN